MSEKKFTPGPWVIGGYPGLEDTEDAPYFYCEGIDGIAMPEDAKTPMVFMNHADANLIAAAPDLYDALADVRTAISRLNGDVSREVWYTLSEFMVAADNALAKARGEA